MLVGPMSVVVEEAHTLRVQVAIPMSVEAGQVVQAVEEELLVQVEEELLVQGPMQVAVGEVEDHSTTRSAYLEPDRDSRPPIVHCFMAGIDSRDSRKYPRVDPRVDQVEDSKSSRKVQKFRRSAWPGFPYDPYSETRWVGSTSHAPSTCGTRGSENPR